ncbi:hypothetical protein CEXT_656271 [Caerostris extrusa]|uniref:Uncharacterized protein n=1 Tax=Caerostris extrusa TaxID=172846 RepID=A0AAV4U1A9_CAEEX|nr:hypothetical protein CEXT_656271 [Caerostris extrusa]
MQKVKIKGYIHFIFVNNSYSRPARNPLHVLALAVFQVLNQPAEAPDEEKPDSSGTTNFLSVPLASDARKSTDSINSCASTRCIVDICPNESFSGRDDISI